MDLDELRFRLTQCNRALLEIQYCYDEALELHEMLLGRKSTMENHIPPTPEIEHYLSLLEEEIMYANETLERARLGLEFCSNTRVNIERQMNVNPGR
ncbi:hypothetical protein NDI52_32435 [Leptolyngbya sp. PL-A3]|uniref:hypothetical protein n=1 Tax=Leptolyngbya sp. PL-A3 TaxID=2933911 RepID=UPI0032994057